MRIFNFAAAQPGVPDPVPALLVVAAWLEIGGGGARRIDAQVRKRP